LRKRGYVRVKEGKKMAYKFPSEEWLVEYGKAINASEDYKKAAANWEGVVAFIFNAAPDIGLDKDFVVWADLWHGECREMKRVRLEEAAEAPYIISGNYANIKKVFQGKLDPVKATVQGKIKVKGNFATLVRYVKAVEAMIKCGASVPTEFLDE
jgi:putative sterol carrier protein